MRGRDHEGFKDYDDGWNGDDNDFGGLSKDDDNDDRSDSKMRVMLKTPTTISIMMMMRKNNSRWYIYEYNNDYINLNHYL